MKNNQAELFQTGGSIRQKIESGSSPESDFVAEHYTETARLTLTDTDQNMMDIVSTYIKKLPDKNTKKHVARIMINFIIKSANL